MNKDFNISLNYHTLKIKKRKPRKKKKNKKSIFSQNPAGFWDIISSIAEARTKG